MDLDIQFQDVYDRLRAIARARLAGRQNGNTLQPTALVHEAFLRMRGGDSWRDEDHFFCAASESMRHILVDQARRKSTLKKAAGRHRVDAELEDLEGLLTVAPDTILAIDEALTRLEEHSAALAQLVKLRFFAGLRMDEVAAVTGVPERTLYRQWRLAAARLRADLSDEDLAELLPPDDTDGVLV